MFGQFSHTYKRGRELTEAEIQQAGAEQAEREALTSLIGQTVPCQWGQWRVYAVVTRIGKAGQVYAHRWNNRRKCWTTEHQIYPWKGIWTTEAQ